MSTTTLRVDDALRQRIVRLADALDQTPHSFMIEALAQKADEAEWKLALQKEAQRRDKAMQKAGSGLDWQDVRLRLNQKLAEKSKAAKAAKTSKAAAKFSAQ
jgi:predicted transcriptional regulator